MSEPSPEAAVAGQAAAAAVESLQSNQETASVAETALVEAEAAGYVAESAVEAVASAEMVAATASEDAAMAVGIGLAADDTAVQALETAQVATVGVNELYEQFCAERDANAAFRSQMSALLTPSAETSSFEEVSVTDDSGTGNTTGTTGSTGQGTAEETGAQTNPDQARRRLRHRSR